MDKITFPYQIKLIQKAEKLLPVGSKVRKKSNKPFKSGEKINTIKGYTIHPKLLVHCYTFEEDNSYVEIRRCIEVENVA